MALSRSFGSSGRRASEDCRRKSSEAVSARRQPSGLKTALVTRSVWPWKMAKGLPESASQSRAVRKLVTEPSEGNQPIYLYEATVKGYTRKQDVYSTLPEGQTTIV